MIEKYKNKKGVYKATLIWEEMMVFAIFHVDNTAL